MLLDSMHDGIKNIFQYVTRLKTGKKLLHKFAEAMRGKSVVYFSLHRVLPDDPSLYSHPHYLNKTAFGLRQIVKFLTESKKNFNFVSLRESLELLKGERALTASSAVLILEAPFYQSLQLLMPIINELAIPISVMLSEHSLRSGQMLWMDEVVYRLGLSTKKELSLNYLDRSFPLNNPSERVLASMHVIEHLSYTRPALFLQRLQELRELLDEGTLMAGSERICTVTYLQKLMENKLVSYACAGYFHTPLADDLTRASLEIVNAQEQLRAWFTQALVPVFFAPLGLDKKHHKELINMMMDHAYQALITRTRGICHPGDNLFSLKRLALSHQSHDLSQFELQALSETIDNLLLISLAQDKKL